MNTPTLAQKILLRVLYGLVLLMIVFSLIAIKDKDQEGFQKCVDNKCQQRGEQFCSKFREINNCCLGASGIIAVGANNQYTCTFNS